MERRRLGVAERDRRLEVGDRLDRRRERACPLAGGGVGERRALVIARQLEVAGQDRGRVADPGRSRDPPVDEPPAREPDAVLGDRAQPLVREVVIVVSLDDQSAGGELLERRGDLVLRSPAREPERLGVERPADQRRGAEHLARRVADRVEPRLDGGARAARSVEVAGAAREQLGDKQRQPLAVAEDNIALGFLEAGVPGQARSRPGGSGVRA